jgi:hypothetical protein
MQIITLNLNGIVGWISATPSTMTFISTGLPVDGATLIHPAEKQCRL